MKFIITYWVCARTCVPSSVDSCIHCFDVICIRCVSYSHSDDTSSLPSPPSLSSSSFLSSPFHSSSLLTFPLFRSHTHHLSSYSLFVPSFLSFLPSLFLSSHPWLLTHPLLSSVFFFTFFLSSSSSSLLPLFLLPLLNLPLLILSLLPFPLPLSYLLSLRQLICLIQSLIVFAYSFSVIIIQYP